ncbi:MAG: hypothetical protein J6D08_10035 [Lachnospiraceae bacterium]|nr:hypothetical protein [Lachnospiraceae bacterium]
MRKAGQLSVHRRAAVVCRNRLAENADIFLWVIRYISENPHGRGFRTKRVYGRRAESGRGCIQKLSHHPLENSHSESNRLYRHTTAALRPNKIVHTAER